MNRYFVHYESRSSLISDYRTGLLGDCTLPIEYLEQCRQGFRGHRFLLFPDLETCWLNPQSYRGLFDLQGHRLEDLPGYEEAEQSAQRWLQKQTKYRDAHSDSRVYTQKETPALQAKWLEHLDETPFALMEEPGQSIIVDACLALDDKLFLEMARVIRNRHLRDALDLLDVQTAICWTKCLLWLMTDLAARTFIRTYVRFEKPGDRNVRYAGYTKMRQRMKLYQQPKPVLRFSNKGSILGLDKVLAGLSNVKR